MKRTFLLAAVAVAAAGCGAAGPTPVPVHGRVTLDGQPLVGKTVKFVPDPGTPGVGAGGTTGPDGGYTLIAAQPGATRDTPGAPPGAYRVVVVERMFPTDLPVQSSSDTTPAPAIGLPSPSKKKQEIPAAYGAPETTPLRVTVPTNGGVIDLAVASPPKK